MCNTIIESAQKMKSVTTLLRLCLKIVSTLVAIVAATNSSLGIETDFKGAKRNLPIIKLQSVAPF